MISISVDGDDLRHDIGRATSLPMIPIGLLVVVLGCGAADEPGERPAVSRPTTDTGDTSPVTCALDTASSITETGTLDTGTAPAEPEPCSLDWAIHLGSTNYDEVHDAALAPDGTIVIGGYFAQPIVFAEGEPNETTLTPLCGGSDDAFLAKYETDGTLVWASRVAQGCDYVRITTLAVDPSGDIVVGGTYSDDVVFAPGLPEEVTLPAANAHYGDLFFARFDGDGNFEWAAPALTPAIFDEVNDVAIGDDGTLYFAGGYDDRITFGGGTPDEITLVGPQPDEWWVTDQEMWLAAYTPDGQVSWAASAGAPDYPHYATAVTALPGGPVLTGFYTSHVTFGLGEPNETTLAPGIPPVGLTSPIAQYGHDGTLSWAGLVGGDSAYGLQNLNGSSFLMVGDSGGDGRNVFGLGTPTETTLDEYVYYLARYTAAGDLEWVQGADRGPSTIQSHARAVATGPDSVATAGWFNAELVFPDGTTFGGPNDEHDPFAASYTHDGDFLCGWGMTGSDEGEV